MLAEPIFWVLYKRTSLVRAPRLTFLRTAMTLLRRMPRFKSLRRLFACGSQPPSDFDLITPFPLRPRSTNQVENDRISFDSLGSGG